MSGIALAIFGTIGITTGSIVVGNGGKVAIITGIVAIGTGVGISAGIGGGADGKSSSHQATR